MRVFWAFLLFCLFFLFPQPVLAADFSVGNEVTYTVLDDTTTHAVFKIFLTNTTSQYYASEYKIKLGLTHISNVTASDPDGPISPVVEKNGNEYDVHITFNKKVVGIGKTLAFTIGFDTTDIVQKQGTIYEVDIPGISQQNDFSSFNVNVVVPQYFGETLYIKPDTGSKELSFTKEQLKSGGISIAFGENQIYALSLVYHLKNSHVFPIRTEIALPPNTNYQEVSIDSISPKPLNVTKDADGNWLAQYTLTPSQKEDVIVKARIKVFLTPKEQETKEEQLQKYLLPQVFWEADNKDIIKLAKKLKTPEAIYTYVVDHLSYDYKRVTDDKKRLGALGVLADPTSSVCIEFTDLFITLARAAGIPAREVEGYGYAQNTQERPVSLVKDVLHAWPEYYDVTKKTWIMIDPTWANTTHGIDYFHVLDFDHIVFVIKGMDSEYPVPAGGYKLSGDEKTQDVSVTFTDDTVFRKPKPAIIFQIGRIQIAGMPVTGNVILTNTGGPVIAQSLVSIKDFVLLPALQEKKTPEILPFGWVSIPFDGENTNVLFRKDGIISAQFEGIEKISVLQVVPLFLLPFLSHKIGFILGGIFVTTLTLIIFIIARGSGGIPFFRRRK